MALDEKAESFGSIADIEKHIKDNRGKIVYKNTAFSVPDCGGECQDALWKAAGSCENSGLVTEFYSCEGCKNSATISFNIKYA